MPTAIQSSAERAAIEALDRAQEAIVGARKLVVLAFRHAKGDRPRLASTGMYRNAVMVEVPPPDSLGMTVSEAAVALRLGEEQVRRLLRQGRLLGVPYGGRRGWQVTRSSVSNYCEERAQRSSQTPALESVSVNGSSYGSHT
jgi:excisionase family DNA binding protein